ncbi:LOW QUALITY PROTEIN: hypothetical protein MC885_004190 [Smutsia gigantea]|nr:LOW QUALITY PROTEIN: hypothetical protein MC885_004190 [Smutsia gigantea]
MLTHERHDGCCEDAAALEQEGQASAHEDGQVATEPAEREGEFWGWWEQGHRAGSPGPPAPECPTAPALMTVLTAWATRPRSTELSSLTMRTRQVQSTRREAASRMKPTARQDQARQPSHLHNEVCEWLGQHLKDVRCMRPGWQAGGAQGQRTELLQQGRGALQRQQNQHGEPVEEPMHCRAAKGPAHSRTASAPAARAAPAPTPHLPPELAAVPRVCHRDQGAGDGRARVDAHDDGHRSPDSQHCGGAVSASRAHLPATVPGGWGHLRLAATMLTTMEEDVLELCTRTHADDQSSHGVGQHHIVLEDVSSHLAYTREGGALRPWRACCPPHAQLPSHSLTAQQLEGRAEDVQGADEEDVLHTQTLGSQSPIWPVTFHTYLSRTGQCPLAGGGPRGLCLLLPRQGQDCRALQGWVVAMAWVPKGPCWPG